MTDILLQYGLFLAEVATVVVAVGALIVLVFGLARRDRPAAGLAVEKLNEKYESMTRALQRAVLSRKAFRAEVKAQKAARKSQRRAQEREQQRPRRRRLFVIDFHGDIRASGIASLREEVTAVLRLATPEDEVLVRLENAGGLVPGHGLAASQLTRIRRREIPLTIAVDKIAASGGYMMACVGNRILAAPFAVLGSIGVLAQLPNFNRLLDSHGVDVEQFKAGEHKRTVTLFGKNTDADRAKLKQELEDMHRLFKEFVGQNRPRIDIDRVATGEHWYGTRALALNLVDELTTSDDYLLAASADADLFAVSYSARRTLGDRLASLVQACVERVLMSLWQRAEEGRYRA